MRTMQMIVANDHISLSCCVVRIAGTYLQPTLSRSCTETPDRDDVFGRAGPSPKNLAHALKRPQEAESTRKGLPCETASTSSTSA